MAADPARTLNALALAAVCAVLTAAFWDQVSASALPCPLCILQRAGFGLLGFALALNVLFGARPSHYGIAILGALAGAAVSTRQIMLHIAPGTGSYGAAFFGLHLYTLAFISFALAVLGLACLLLWDRQFGPGTATFRRPAMLAAIALGWFGLLLLGNALSTFAECTTGLCSDNPTGYLLWTPAAP